MKLKCIFKHDWKRTSERPLMVSDENSSCSYQMEVTCQRCGKVKDVWSDIHLGMKIVRDKSEIREEKLSKILEK